MNAGSKSLRHPAEREVPTAPGRLPVIGHGIAMLRGKLAFTAGLAAHGDIVRVHLGTLPVYFVTSAELIDQVLATETDKFDKGALGDKLRDVFGNGLVSTNGDFYRRQRRMIQPAFHRRPIGRYTAMMAESAAELADSWRSGQVVDVERAMQDLALVIAGRSLFSLDFAREVRDVIRDEMPVMLRLGVVRAITSTPLLERLPIPANRRFDRAIARVHAVVDRVAASAREDRDDLLSALVRARDENGEPMSREQVRDEVVTLLVGGSETTGNTLAWLFHELAAHPDVLDRVTAEVEEVVGTRPVAFEDLNALPYTRRVVSEVLRRYPLWFMLRRTNTTVSLGGVEFPPGTEIGFSTHAVHHDPRYHRDPDVFDPDRWLPERVGALPRGAYVPFAAGLHHCPGHFFAMAELMVVAATVLSRRRLVPVPGRPPRPRVTGLIYPGPLPMTVH
ncbi:cytochrome P450 [Saccharothrix violaceirubra]|uniref:Cytochrome P450 n=1 Tax=Saccharothrix violaceirubra TaxID=413306 RepID=A0A7W7T4R2_9PSEU|nr:cytochrome P450 [Saccharothrix violaceirubra]MBB4965280.1 cytochrome P450 [Saccharothrix violaceirubra]